MSKSDEPYVRLNEIPRTLKLHQVPLDGGVNGGVIGGVNEVRLLIKKHPGARANAIASTLNISLRTVERYLKQLKDNSIIEFRGAPRNGGYFLKEQAQ